MNRIRPKALLATTLVLGLVWLGNRLEPTVDAGPGDFETDLQAAFDEGRSGVWVEGHATLVRHLADDHDGSRHQRFVVRLGSGQTLLLSHNIDIASRLTDTRAGDRISFRGRYEWNEMGGVVHWTHRDPQGRLEGGWIEAAGKRVR